MAEHSTTILIIDIGAVETTATLLMHVDGRYELTGQGVTNSTCYAPTFDVWHGCVSAIRKLEGRTQRLILANDESVIHPTNLRGEGVDYVVVTTSAGPSLKLVAAGLLEDVSLKSCRRLAASVGGKLVDQISLTKGSAVDAHLDRALKTRPEIIVLAGGTEGGASRAVIKTAELIKAVCHLLPGSKRPAVLYAGNQAIADQIKAMLDGQTEVIAVANIRPSMEKESLSAAQYALAEILAYIRTKQVGGLNRAAQNSVLPLLPTSFTFGRTMRLLSTHTVTERNPVLGVSVESNQTTLADAFRGSLRLDVLPYGTGTGVSTLLENTRLEEIQQWIASDLPSVMVRDYLHQKALYPASVPIDQESLLIEQAMIRVILQLSMTHARQLFEKPNNGFTKIVAAGNALTNGPTIRHSLLMLLDGIQPSGLTQFVLDEGQLMAAIGAAAAIDSAVPVHMLASSLFAELGTVISPVSEEKIDRPIVHAKLHYQDGSDVTFEVKKGEIKVVPLQPRQEAELEITALGRTWITENPVRTRLITKIVGGLCGLVIDGRGRPIYLPSTRDDLLFLQQTWRQQIGISSQVMAGRQ